MTWIRCRNFASMGAHRCAWDFIDKDTKDPTDTAEPHWRLWLDFMTRSWEADYWDGTNWQGRNELTQEFIALLSDEEKASAMAAAINYNRRNAT